MVKIQKIMCVVEVNEKSKHTLIQAISIAKRLRAKIEVISITENDSLRGPSPKNKAAQLAIINKKRSQLKNWVDEFFHEGQFETTILNGVGFIEIIKYVSNNKIDLLIKSAENPNWVERIFGNLDKHLLRKCPCP